MKPRTIITLLVAGALAAFLGWRFVRPLNIFVVSDAFERAIDTTDKPDIFQTLHAEECGACHQDFYDEWRTTVHSQAWTDPYFQTDWQFDDAQHVCRNCHTPLDRQQPHEVLGFKDKAKWNPKLAPNPGFDPKLQHEGVTCAACHLREGKIVGVLGTSNAPHPVRKLDNPNQICVRCHVVEGDRWDTFFRFPPCGTVAEIQTTDESTLSSGEHDEASFRNLFGMRKGKTGELSVADTAALGCVQCHMPLVKRSLVDGGPIRSARQHLWRGGHDPEMVKRALAASFQQVPSENDKEYTFNFTLSNVGAAHYVPTGTPDRYLSVKLRALDAADKVIKQQEYNLIRTVLWRPFIIDLRDTRLPRGQPKTWTFSVDNNLQPVMVEAVVRYHLLNEKRRARINYKNTDPIAYQVSRQVLAVTPHN